MGPKNPLIEKKIQKYILTQSLDPLKM